MYPSLQRGRGDVVALRFTIHSGGTDFISVFYTRFRVLYVWLKAEGDGSSRLGI